MTQRAKLRVPLGSALHHKDPASKLPFVTAAVSSWQVPRTPEALQHQVFPGNEIWMFAGQVGTCDLSCLGGTLLAKGRWELELKKACTIHRPGYDGFRHFGLLKSKPLQTL